MSRKGLVLYTSKTCPYCEDAKKMLRDRGVKFKEISTDTAQGTREADELGITELPTLVKDGQICEEIKSCIS